MFARGSTLLLLVLAACAEPVRVVTPAPAAPTVTQALPAAAAAATAPAECGLQGVAEDVLRRVNAARAAGRQCGGHRMAPAAPLRWDTGLQSAAAAHSRDMAARNFFDHRNPDGRHVRDRVNVGPVRWKMVGENIAAGPRSVPEALQDWLDSPSHCENLMEPAFTDVGVSCARQPGTRAGTYWTMVLGRR